MMITGRLMNSGLFLLASLFLLFASPAKADFQLVHRGDSDRLIIFVHGLWGDPEESFLAEGAGKSWPMLMSEDTKSIRQQLPLSEYSIATLGYPATRTDQLSIPQIASRLLTDLVDDGVLDDYQAIHFISYSLGGLVVKEILIEASATRERMMLVVKTKSVFFIATPSEGSPITRFLPRVIAGRLVADLATIADNTYLQSLDNRWRGFVEQPLHAAISVFCAHETQSVAGVLIVPQEYASCVGKSRAENADHITIVKPRTVDDSIYRWVRGRIAERNLLTSDAWTDTTFVPRSPTAADMLAQHKQRLWTEQDTDEWPSAHLWAIKYNQSPDISYNQNLLSLLIWPPAFKECAEICHLKPECKVWVFNRDVGLCTLYADTLETLSAYSNRQWRSSDGEISGIKNG